MSRIVVALLALSLAACGMKLPLSLPPGPPSKPVLDSLRTPDTPETAATQTGNDLSTDQKSSSQ